MKTEASVASAAGSRAAHERETEHAKSVAWIQCSNGGLTSRGSPSKRGTTGSWSRSISTEVRAKRLSSVSISGIEPARTSRVSATTPSRTHDAIRNLRSITPPRTGTMQLFTSSRDKMLAVTQDMIHWLYGLQHFGIKLGLDNIRALLELLDHPERRYASAHIAGTNGKGSVAAMIDAMLGAGGVPLRAVHLAAPGPAPTSASAWRDADIGSDELHERLAAMRETIERGLADERLEVHPSFFEVITGTALKAFADHDLQAAVLEVGLGGRLDATNAVDADVGVIVSIDLDHTKTLGRTLELIAREKAGIIKPGRPVVSGATQPVVVELLREICRERGAEYVDARQAARLSRPMTTTRDASPWRPPTRRYPDLRCDLPGRHQVDNARVALAAFERLADAAGLDPDPDAVRAGLAAVRWAGPPAVDRAARRSAPASCSTARTTRRAWPR